MGHCLKAVVGSELAVDVMEVITERLSGNAQLSSDGPGVLATGEQLQDATLVLRERFDRCVMG